MKLKIEHDLKRFERELGAMGKEIIPKAAPSALNRTTKTVASVAVKTLSKTTGIQQKKVKKDFHVKLADRVNMTAYIDASEKRASNLSSFVTPARRRPSGGPGKPQFFRKRKGRKTKRAFAYRGVEAKAWNKKKVYGGAFIAQGKSNNPIVMVRMGDGRNAQTKVLHGPSVRREFDKQPFRDTLIAKANERFPIEMRRSIDNVLRRIKK